MKISFLDLSAFNFIPVLVGVILLIILLTFFIALYDFKNKRFNRDKFKIFNSILRSVILILMVLAMAGMSINIMSEDTQTMFIADGSASIKNKSKVADFINKSLKNKPLNEESGFISFGENTNIEKKPSLDNGEFEFSTNIEEEKTNIEQALSSAMAVMNKEDNKRLILVSDGGENVGDSLSYAEEIKKNGGVINTYYIDDAPENEVQLSKLNLPSQIGKGSKYDIEVVIYSTADNEGKLTVTKENKEIYSQEVKLKGGENKFTISDVADLGGGITLKAEITAQKDTYKNNNIQYAYTNVKDMPRVLIIENKENSGEELFQLLSTNGFRVDRKYAGDIYTLKSFSAYDEVIISDCSYEEIGKEAVDSLESYVKDSGGGLLVTGGENSFGLGGYEATKLGDILPINMQPIDETEENGLSMIVVLDRSGSMNSGEYGVTGLSLAKSAVISSIDELKDKDSFGVIAFDDAPTVINKLENVKGKKEEIKKKVQGIDLGGGTSIIPALEEAVNQLEASKDKYKHIILLTDGQGENSGYSQLADRIKKNGITLSSVAVGAEADTRFLKALAKIGEGRYYFTDEFSDLPNIFINETKKASKELINEKDFYPKAVNSGVLNDIEKMPMLKGYISSSAKGDSEIALKSETDEPVLAFNSYGLGKSCAFMVDVKNWCGNWLSTEEGSKILLSSVSKVMKNNNSEVIKAELKTENGKSYILATTNDNNVDIKKGSIVAKDYEKELEFKLVSANKYRAEVDSLAEDFYTINVTYDTKDNKNNNYITYSYISWPAEYDFSNRDAQKALLTDLAELTGGEVLNSESDIFKKIEPKVIKCKNLSNILMTIALILFIIDIGVRRFKREFLNLINKIYSIFNKNNSFGNEKAKEVINAENVKSSTESKEAESDNKASEKKKSTAELLAQSKKKRDGR